MAVLPRRVPAPSARARLAAPPSLASSSRLLAAPAAAAPPAVTLDKQAPERQLFGTEPASRSTRRTRAASPTATTSASATCCPRGVSYVAGSAPSRRRSSRTRRPPARRRCCGRTSATSPRTLRTTSGTRSAIRRRARRRRHVHEPGRRLHRERPALHPGLHPTGEPVAEADVASMADSDGTLLIGARGREGRAEPRGRAPARRARPQDGLHAYLRNNEIHPTSGMTLEDWLPAGLEYLACATDDNTAAREYPGAPPLDASAPVAPRLPRARRWSRRSERRSRRRRRAAAGVYTHVAGTASRPRARRVRRIQYVAAIPIRENTLDFGRLHAYVRVGRPGREPRQQQRR